jgi:SAM-dependent methyltransferase
MGFAKQKDQAIPLPSWRIAKIISYKKYCRHVNNHKDGDAKKFLFEKSLLPSDKSGFTHSGYCYICKKPVDFLVTFQYSYEVNNVVMPVWRETLNCPHCYFNNRMRATVHLFEQECKPTPDSKIYMTEQVTPLYSLFKAAYHDTCGSEYIGDTVAYGSCNEGGIRNEDVTRLSFDNDEFDFILSFDVFEHVPDYKSALRECYRCLKPGGSLFFSVPFARTSEKNIVRAALNEDGSVNHILPAEYHGDPLSPGADKCLCYYHFGWEVIDDLKAVGFTNAHALLYWSPEFGYLGGEQVQCKATKPRRSHFNIKQPLAKLGNFAKIFLERTRAAR